MHEIIRSVILMGKALLKKDASPGQQHIEVMMKNLAFDSLGVFWLICRFFFLFWRGWGGSTMGLGRRGQLPYAAVI